MAESPSTVGALFKAGEISNDAIDAAAEAFLAHPDTGSYPIAAGYRLDLAAAVKAHRFSTAALAEPGRSDRYRRQAVRTAILLARPVPA